MRYYIRHDKHAKVEGPFTVEALIEAIRTGRLPSDSLASGCLGEGISSLQAYRGCDWYPLSAIAELRGVLPPLPEPPAKPRHVSVFTVFAHVALTQFLFYRAITEQRWWLYSLAVFWAYGAVHKLIRYVRQRETVSLAG